MAICVKGEARKRGSPVNDFLGRCKGPVPCRVHGKRMRSRMGRQVCAWEVIEGKLPLTLGKGGEQKPPVVPSAQTEIVPESGNKEILQ